MTGLKRMPPHVCSAQSFNGLLTWQCEQRTTKETERFGWVAFSAAQRLFACSASSLAQPTHAFRRRCSGVNCSEETRDRERRIDRAELVCSCGDQATATRRYAESGNQTGCRLSKKQYDKVVIRKRPTCNDAEAESVPCTHPLLQKRSWLFIFHLRLAIWA